MFMVGLALSLLGFFSATQAQQPPLPVIGYLKTAGLSKMDDAFLQGLSETGYREGQNVLIDRRSAEGHYDRLPALAAELVRRHVAVIVASGGNAPALAAKAATSTIPIVFLSGGDPVQAGLVSSLNRPGGNVTGVTIVFSTLTAKRLELLHELVPRAEAISTLVNPNYQEADLQVRELHEAAKALRLQVELVKASTPSEIDAAFTALARYQARALLIANEPFLLSRSEQIAALAARQGIPTIYWERQSVAAGGLMSYGPNLTNAYRRGGIYTGRILRGANPADLPVEQPTQFELVINLKTATALGLTIPQSILIRADEVIR
jgi:putative tryptophan/tyrosine transport system substrate-binding protein